MSLFDAPLVQQLAPLLETAINRAIAMDPASEKHLKRLNGCVLEVNVTSISQSFFFGVSEQKVSLQPSDTAPSVILCGTASAFAKLAFMEDKNSLFRRKEISLSGDAVRAQQIQNLMRSLKLDWEALLAEAIGDVPARFLSVSLSSGIQWSKSISRSLKQDLEEFIKYELRLLPGKRSAQRQFEAIDQLRLATDRLEARFKQLLSKTPSVTPTPSPSQPEKS